MNVIGRALDSYKGNELARNASWIFLGQGLSLVIQAGYFVVLARLLGSLEYGVYAGVVALVTLFSSYGSLGSGLLFLQHVSPDRTRFPQYWGNILISTLTLGSCLSILIAIVGPRVVGSQPGSLLLVAAVSDCVFQQLTTATGVIFQTFNKMKITAGINTVVNLCRLLIAFSMYLSKGHASASEWAVAVLLVSCVACVLAVVMVSVNFGAPSFQPRLFFEHVTDGLVYAVSGSTTTIYNDVDKVMLSHYGLTMANGIYSLAYRVLNISTLPMGSIYSAAFPKFFSLGSSGLKATISYARRLVRTTSLLAICIGLALVLGSPLLPWLVGAGFKDSALAVRWLCLIPFFRSLQLSAGDALAGAGKQRYRLLTQSTAAVLNVTLNLILIPRYSWRGAAWASVATDGCLALMNWAALWVLCSFESRRSEMAQRS